MPKREVLYVKGMNISECEVSGSDVDIWDDTKLNEAYDKALRMANAEVAKRIAMSTNYEINKGNEKKSNSASKATPGKNIQSKPDDNEHWSAGMPCRTVYDEDGLEYEAFLLKLIDDKECVVRFLGYENSEIVPISSLKPSLGKEERILQIRSACNENAEDSLSQRSLSSNVEGMEIGSDQNSNIGVKGRSKHKKKKSQKKNERHPRQDAFKMPNMSFNMPNMSFAMPNLQAMKQFGSMELPLPPPPPLNFAGAERPDSEDQAVSSMLLSWYMSGYYTGLYQGLKRAKRSSRND